MNIEQISDLNGSQFSKLINRIKEVDQSNSIYQYFMNNYFSEYSTYDDPILESWNNDYDEVWDAEAALISACNRMDAKSEIIKLIKKIDINEL